MKAIIFDLDGVLVFTDRYHYLGWKKLADRLGIYFDEEINNRLRGVSRMDSLEIVLEKSTIQYSQAEKELYDFILSSKNQDVRDRASFYLGECYYYNGKLSDAVRIFTSLKDKFPALSRKWTDATLDIYEIK